jgi:hypothetical protein
MTLKPFVIVGKAKKVFRTIEIAALYEVQHKRVEARDLLLIQLQDDKRKANEEKNDGR